MSDGRDVKNNVAVFNQDVSQLSGYQYTVASRLSTRLSNGRMTRGIREAADFRGKRVLDIGCGDGVFTMALAEMGAARVLGVDPATEAVMIARENAEAADPSRISFRVRSVYDLSEEDGQFDIAVMRGVLHHLPDAARAIAVAAKLAGELVVLEPNGTNPVLKIIEKVSPYHIEHEEQSFLPGTLDRWLEECGARVEHRQFINLVPIFCPAVVARLLKFLEPIVERTPGLRRLATGQYVLRAKTSLGSKMASAR